MSVPVLREWAADGGQQHLITAVNWAELRYIVERKAGHAQWLKASESLACFAAEVVDIDRGLAERAAKFKAAGGISLADCFAAALAQELDIPVYTGDPEFRLVEPEIEVRWL